MPPTGMHPDGGTASGSVRRYEAMPAAARHAPLRGLLAEIPESTPPTLPGCRAGLRRRRPASSLGQELADSLLSATSAI